MKKYLLKPLTLSLGIAILTAGTVAAQEKVKIEEKKEIIGKKGDKDEKMEIIIKDGEVSINGKKMADMSEEEKAKYKDHIIINKDGSHRGVYFNESPNAKIRYNMEIGHKPFLGVVTEKVSGGVKITEVVKESAAEKAGLKVDDVITKVGDTKISSPEDLVDAIGKQKPNDKVTVSYTRGGKAMTASATLGERKEDFARVFQFGPDEHIGRNFEYRFAPPRAPRPPMPHFEDILKEYKWEESPKYGISVQDTEDGTGARILEVEEKSNAANAGLKKDDIITEFDGKAIKNVSDLTRQVRESREKSKVKVQFNRGNKSQSVEVVVPKKLRKADL